MKIRNLTLWSLSLLVLTVAFTLACQPTPSPNTSTTNASQPANSAAANSVVINSTATSSADSMSPEKMQKIKDRDAKLTALMLQNPCSVEIWEDENYTDNNDVIVGPGKWSNMRGLPGANKGDWGDEIDSLKVGSKATVKVWEDENFGDTSQTYGPGTEKTNLRGNPDMGDNIDSMEITCSP
jgi:hypothetical protein